MNQSNTMLPASVMAAFMIFADAKNLLKLYLQGNNAK